MARLESDPEVSKWPSGTEFQYPGLMRVAPDVTTARILSLNTLTGRKNSLNQKTRRGWIRPLCCANVAPPRNGAAGRVWPMSWRPYLTALHPDPPTILMS